MHVRLWGRELSLAVTDEQVATAKSVSRQILREPFTRRPWAELAFYLVSGGLAVRRAGLRGRHHGDGRRAGDHLLRPRRPGAVHPQRARHRRLAAGPGPCHARRADRGPRGLRRPPRLPRLAAVVAARPRRLAGRRLPGRQGALDRPRLLRGVQPVVGRVRLPHPSGLHVRIQQLAGLRPGAEPVPGLLLRPRRLPSRRGHPRHRRRLLVRGAVGDARLRQRRPHAHARPARTRSHGGPGAHARAGAVADRRRLGGHPAPDRARPARRHPGAAGGPRHAAGHGQGEARGRR